MYDDDAGALRLMPRNLYLNLLHNKPNKFPVFNEL